MIILNKEPRQITLCRFVDGERQNHVLQPGSNEIDDAEFEKYMLNTICKSFFAKGGPLKISTVAEPVPSLVDGWLAEVAACEEPHLLRRWVDSRAHVPIVRDAIIKRHMELTKDEPIEHVDADGPRSATKPSTNNGVSYV
jgi:hypothetical protein